MKQLSFVICGEEIHQLSHINDNIIDDDDDGNNALNPFRSSNVEYIEFDNRSFQQCGHGCCQQMAIFVGYNRVCNQCAMQDPDAQTHPHEACKGQTSAQFHFSECGKASKPMCARVLVFVGVRSMHFVRLWTKLLPRCAWRPFVKSRKHSFPDRIHAMHTKVDLVLNYTF
jgi:hypothetical protein